MTTVITCSFHIASTDGCVGILCLLGVHGKEFSKLIPRRLPWLGRRYNRHESDHVGAA